MSDSAEVWGDMAEILLENRRYRKFIERVMEYSNDGWLAREARALIEGREMTDE